MAWVRFSTRSWKTKGKVILLLGCLMCLNAFWRPGLTIMHQDPQGVFGRLMKEEHESLHLSINLTHPDNVSKESESARDKDSEPKDLPHTPAKKSLIDDLFKVNQSLLTPEMYRITGKVRNDTGYLTIGIPSIWRPVVGAEYLMNTISSLITNSNAEQMDDVVILIFLADFNQTYREMTKQNLTEKYGQYLERGIIQIMEVEEDVYPPLTNLKQNFKDKPERVTWRSKQNCDFAYMFDYGSRLSRYYLQLEDDVETVPNYLQHIKNYITSQKKPWIVLNFSTLGFIGKLMRAEDVAKLARFLLFFYSEMPVDYLLPRFTDIQTFKKYPMRNPTLFQHYGEHSSLLSKNKNTLKDKFFPGYKEEKSTSKGNLQRTRENQDNPEASIFSCMKYYDKYTPEWAYDKNPKRFFWGINPEVNSTLSVIFRKPQQLKRIILTTGHPVNNRDTLENGRLIIGSNYTCVTNTTTSEQDHDNVHRQDEICQCVGGKDVGHLEEGSIDVTLDEHTQGTPISCLELQVLQAQQDWLVVNRITVWGIKSKRVDTPRQPSRGTKYRRS